MNGQKLKSELVQTTMKVYIILKFPHFPNKTFTIVHVGGIRVHLLQMK
jgi:hypothetical protein